MEKNWIQQIKKDDKMGTHISASEPNSNIEDLKKKKKRYELN